MQSFSNRLYDLRRERRLTQAELATANRLQRSTVSGYETECKEPNFSTLCQLAEFFNVTVDYLLGISETRSPNNIAFANDTINFTAIYNQMPPDIKELLDNALENLYILLSKTVKQKSKIHLELYAELLSILREKRAIIHSTVKNNDYKNPLTLSTLMTEQSNFKNDICLILDKLLQADMGVSIEKEPAAISSK